MVLGKTKDKIELTFTMDIKDKQSLCCHFSSKLLKKDCVGPLLNEAGDLVTDRQKAKALPIGSIPVACRTSDDVSLIEFVHFLVFKTNQI